MSRVLELLNGDMNGNAWEDLCVRCYRLRYQEQHYVAVPAVHKGDAGIEGYTKTGIVHQCYYPERYYSDEDLYLHLRKKMTADIKKLLKNATRMKSLGVPSIHEWHFNIPEYRDSRILTHASAKQKEVLSAKANKPIACSHIADDFQIVIKIADDFAPEIGCIIRNNYSATRLNLAVQHISPIRWSDCESEKVNNIRRKVKAVMNIEDDSDPGLNKIIGLYVDFYISGVENMAKLRISFPEIYAALYRLEQSYKNEVTIKTTMNTDHRLNNEVFADILTEFGEKLEKDFSNTFDQASIGELKQSLVAGWLADCSMEFRRKTT